MHGNVSTQTRQAFEDLLIEQLSIGSVDPVKSEIKELDQSVLLELNIDHDDASMVMYIQDTDDNISTRATSSLAGQMIGTPYFSDLRTDQQLGYVVNAGARLMNERNGLVFLVQSPVQGADYLEEATASFLAQYLESLGTMTEQEFRQHQDGLINNLLQKDKNLSQRSQRYWSDLKKDNLAFDAAAKAERGENYRKEAAMAKLVATEAGGRVVDRCMQMFGGLGVAKDLPFERWFREMRIRRIGEGPSEVQRHVIARELLGASLR